MNSSDDPWPRSIAIAGAWGYIGRKFLDAAWRQGIVPYVYDPGPAPPDVPLERLQRAASEEEFYRLEADLFHLALHPQARQTALTALLDRARPSRASPRPELGTKAGSNDREPIAILNEKPMAPPERPELCRSLIAAVQRMGEDPPAPGSAGGLAGNPQSPLLLFDFHELYSPLTERIVACLAGRRNVSIESIEMARSKDREDPANPRNYKRMLPIQYQETVHCLAWVLHLLGRLHGAVGGVFDAVAGVCDAGLTVTAQSQPYAAPNPRDYPYIVDGQCVWELQLGSTLVTGRTDFKRGAPWTKRRVVRGTADGRPFTIEAEYQEGRKQLTIDGVDQGADAQSSSPVEVIQTFGRWRREVPRDELLRGIYPNARFAHATYQLSSALWRASYDCRELRFASLPALLDFDAGFAAALPLFPRYK